MRAPKSDDVTPGVLGARGRIYADSDLYSMGAWEAEVVGLRYGGVGRGLRAWAGLVGVKMASSSMEVIIQLGGPCPLANLHA